MLFAQSRQSSTSGSNSALFSLSESELLELAAATTLRRLKAEEVLFLDGEPANRLFVIATGAVRAFR